MSAPIEQIVVFKALNCAFCNSPFAPTPNDSNSPRSLVCGLGICKECFDREKGENENAERPIPRDQVMDAFRVWRRNFDDAPLSARALEQQPQHQQPQQPQQPQHQQPQQQLIIEEELWARNAVDARDMRHLVLSIRPTEYTFNEMKRKVEMARIASKRAKKSGNTKHQCHPQINCFRNPTPAYFLIELIGNQEIVLSPKKDGYILDKPFTTPECPVCNEEYHHDVRQPMVLRCNHVFCKRCLERVIAEDNSDTMHRNCPLCNQQFQRGDVSACNSMASFIKELSAMNEQLKRIQAEKRKVSLRQCVECEKSDYINDMFFCIDCEKTICGACIYRKHRDHDSKELLHDELKRFSSKSRQRLDAQFATDKQVLALLHKRMYKKVGELKEKILKKTSEFVNVETYEEAHEMELKCLKMTEAFEQHFEEYAEQLKRFIDKLMQLVARFEEEFDSEGSDVVLEPMEHQGIEIEEEMNNQPGTSGTDRGQISGNDGGMIGGQGFEHHEWELTTMEPSDIDRRTIRAFLHPGLYYSDSNS